jgi:transcription initiation factor TFIIIB Brf1 subunit/transcription initiation factor TFIIB
MICNAVFETKYPDQNICKKQSCRNARTMLYAEQRYTARKKEIMKRIAGELKLYPDTAERLEFLFYKLLENYPHIGHALEDLTMGIALFLMKQEGYDIGIRLGADWEKQTNNRLHKIIERRIRKIVEAKNLPLLNRITNKTDSQITEFEANIIKLSLKKKKIDDLLISDANQILTGVTDQRVGKSIKAAAFFYAAEKAKKDVTQEQCAKIFGISTVSLRINLAEIIEPKYGRIRKERREGITVIE